MKEALGDLESLSLLHKVSSLEVHPLLMDKDSLRFRFSFPRLPPRRNWDVVNPLRALFALSVAQQALFWSGWLVRILSFLPFDADCHGIHLFLGMVNRWFDFNYLSLDKIYRLPLIQTAYDFFCGKYLKS